MPRYYFHIRIGDVYEDRDPDGEELAHLQAAHAEALEIARDYLNHFGRAEPGTTIEIADESGRAVLSVPFSAAVHPRSQ
jgi:hypothetical protein